ncbi:MAG: hypothetical protein HQM02_06925 [Magnetococcales bacterium]|nr:hypothetical protein [Magnetococcales bacterium]
MIKLLRGILVGGGLGYALFYASGSSQLIYLTSLALLVLVGVLIPLEEHSRHQETLSQELQEIKRRLDQLASSGSIRTGEAEPEDGEEERPASPQPFKPSAEQEHYIPAIQASASEGRTVMAHGRRTVERSVEDVAKKLSSMQR